MMLPSLTLVAVIVVDAKAPSSEGRIEFVHDHVPTIQSYPCGPAPTADRDIGVSPSADPARLGASTAAQAASATMSRFIRVTSAAAKQTTRALAKTQKIPSRDEPRYLSVVCPRVSHFVTHGAETVGIGRDDSRPSHENEFYLHRFARARRCICSSVRRARRQAEGPELMAFQYC